MPWTDNLCMFPLRGKIPVVPFSLLGAGEKIHIPNGYNIGIATGSRSGIIVIDCDNEDAATAFVIRYSPPSTYTVRTKRGCHFYFRQPTGILIKNSVSKLADHIDVRGEGGLVVGAGSTHESGFVYTVIDESDPVDMPAALLADLEPWHGEAAGVSVEPVDPNTPEGHRRIMRAKDWLREAPPAIAGENGSGALFTVALKLMRTYELPLDTAMGLITENYNPRCVPEWSIEEIEHKLVDARDRSDRPTGTAPDGFLERTAVTESVSVAQDGPAAKAPGKLQGLDFSTLCQTLYNHPEWDNVIRFNVLTRQPVAIKPPIPMRMEHGTFSKGDTSRIRLWLAEQGFEAKTEDVEAAVHAIYEMPERKYNPIMEYFQSLHLPDACETLALDHVHSTILNSPDGPMASRLFKKQLVAAAKRAMAMPGLEEPHPVDHRVVLVLEGPQECGKTSLLRLLGGPWYASLKGDVHDAETRLAIQGSLIVEMEEMVTQKKADRDALKAFISTVVDNDRAKYARSAERVQRSYVLFGTSNDMRFDDPTGSARFAPIIVTKMNQAKAELLRDRLWAEAYALAIAGYDHHLDAEEIAFCTERTADYEVEDSVADQLKEALAGIPFVTAFEAYRIIMQAKADPFMAKADEMRFTDALRRIGCKRARILQKCGWLVPRATASLEGKASVRAWLREDQQATNVRESLSKRAN